MDKEKLRQIAKRIRINVIKQVSNAQSGHPGGSLDLAEILAVLYFEEMDITVDNAGSIDRDRLVLSKGHASPALYAVLAEKGILDESELLSFRKLHTRLQGHPDMNSMDGIDMSTGSLGQGFSAAVGMSLANKLSGNDHRIYCICGDGECEEGQIWEAAMAAAHYHCDNLCMIIDENGLQIDGTTESVISPAPFDVKMQAFGWHTVSIDGHDFDAIKAALDEARATKLKPTCIIAKTIKGKGVSFMENEAEWHGKAPSGELIARALKDLEEM